MNTRPIPKRLREEPVLEALCEIRFESDTDTVAELLPGLLYHTLRQRYSRIEKLPAAQLPSVFLQQDTSLRYAPQSRLVGEHYSIQIGEHMVSISCPRPYTGWADLEARIIELSEALAKTGLLNRIERFSLKYTDVIPFKEKPSIEPIKLNISLADYDVRELPVHFRTEIVEGGFLNIVQVVSPVVAGIPDKEQIQGLLVDIDTIAEREFADFWSQFKSMLNETHDVSKGLFFKILADETLERLGPEY